MSRWPLSLDKHLSGLLAPATVEELLTKEFDKQLWPGPYSEAGKKCFAEARASV